MGRNRLLPNSFFISGLPTRKENFKLFRPKQKSDVIFPRISMIMYHPFWIKYTLYLLSNGFNIDAQNDLFFWAEKSGKRYPTKGILYFCLLSIYLKKMDEKSNPDVRVGRRWSKDWLFHKEAYNNIIKIILEITSKVANRNYTDYINNIFSPLFQSVCKNEKMDLEKIFIDIYNIYLSNNQRRTKKLILQSIAHFVESLAEVIIRIKTKLPRYKSDRLIGSNIDFTKYVVLSNNADSSINKLRKIANTNINFKKEELIALLNQLQETENGQNFIKSFLLISLLNPLKHSNKYIIEKMRDFFNYIKNLEDLSNLILNLFPDITFRNKLTDNLLDMCFYWKLNFFLLDGEDIARKIAIHNKKIMTKEDISQLFESTEYSINYNKFINDFYKDESLLDFLCFSFSKKYKYDDIISGFLEILYKCLIQKMKPIDIFIELLLYRETIRNITAETYELIKQVPGIGKAQFWGLESFIGWSKIFLKVLKDG